MARQADKTKRTQILIDLSPENQEKFDRMMHEACLRTPKEVVNNALTLLAWAIQKTKEGRVIAAVNESDHSYTEVILPALENVATTRQAESKIYPTSTSEEP